MKKLLRFSQNRSIFRIIDANLNRVKEGLRVCEEVARFLLDNRILSASFKKLRHDVDAAGGMLVDFSLRLKERESSKDVGRHNASFELKRESVKGIYWANIQRVKESLRVLEEFAKLENEVCALKFKQMRYKIYEIEKSSFKKISTLSDS